MALVFRAAVDLFRANMGFNPAIRTADAAPPETGAIRYLKSRTPNRFVGVSTDIAFQPLPADLAMDFDLFDARSYDYPAEKRYDRMWRRNVVPGAPDYAGVTEGKPGAAMRAVPGVAVDVVNDEAQPVENGSGGYLVITKPWPAMLRTLWGDDQRYVDTYWSRFPEMYFAGDGAKKDEDGDLWLLGRVDDVMNVSGHRMSTTEIESALVSHPKVAEAAVVGATDETTGQAIVAFVILRSDAGTGGDDVVSELRAHVANEIGKIARPRQIMVVEELPKTRSGKIMRRLLRDVAEHRDLGDVTTLTDSSVMDLIKIESLATAGSSEQTDVLPVIAVARDRGGPPRTFFFFFYRYAVKTGRRRTTLFGSEADHRSRSRGRGGRHDAVPTSSARRPSAES